jgi:pimeloyl-ACP methyl ester carboxylesterase
MRMRWLTIAACVLLCAWGAEASRARADGRMDDVRLDAPSPVAGAREVARRTQTPTTFDRMERYVGESGRTLAEHMVRIEDASFDIFVPRKPPPSRGYAVLVWIPPQDAYRAPMDWMPALEAHGMIYVSPRDAGNEEIVFDRRIPLALHAAHGIAARYPVDSERVFVGGFSGGSRTALRVLLAYPDLFRGALLNAGSDIIGGKRLTLPPRELTETFQARARLVYVTGAHDLSNRRADGASLASVREVCVQQVHRHSMGSLGHAVPDRRTFSRVLAWLDPPVAAKIDLGALATCRARVMARVQMDMLMATTLFERGDLAAAGEALGEADQRWGGLAAPASVDLARKIAARREAQ